MRLGFVGDRVRVCLESYRRNNPVERSHVAEKLADGMIAADDRELVAVGVELFTRNNRHWLYCRQIESDSARGGGNVLEQRWHLVAPRNQLTHHLQIDLVFLRLPREPLNASLRHRSACALIGTVERVDMHCCRCQLDGLGAV